MNKTKIDLSLLNDRAWRDCASIARVELSDIPKRPDIRKIREDDWVSVWEEYWSTNKMIDFLQQKGFGILGTKEALIGVTRGDVGINGWFPPAIGENATTYLWRITSTVLNTLDEFGHVGDKTLEKLGFSTVLAKWKLE